MPNQTFRFSRFLSLIRAVFPRWSFFDRVAHRYELSFKVPSAKDWQAIGFSEHRRLLGLFINPRCNLAMAEANLLEHFVSDIGELQDEKGMIDSAKANELTSFRMLRSFLAAELVDFNVSRSSVQFKIAAVTAQDRTDLYVSDWLNMGGL